MIWWLFCGFVGCFVVVCIWVHSRSCSVYRGFDGVVGIICSCVLPTLCWCFCFAGCFGVCFWSVGWTCGLRVNFRCVF